MKKKMKWKKAKSVIWKVVILSQQGKLWRGIHPTLSLTNFPDVLVELPDVTSDMPNWRVNLIAFTLDLLLWTWYSSMASWRTFHARDPGQIDLWKAVLLDLLWIRCSRCENEVLEGCAVTNLLTLVFTIKESQTPRPAATSRPCLNPSGMMSSRLLARYPGRADCGNVQTRSYNSWFQQMSVSNAREWGQVD